MVVALIWVMLLSLVLVLLGIVAPQAQVYFKKERRTAIRAVKVFGSTAAAALLVAIIIAPSPATTTAPVLAAPPAGVHVAAAAPVPAVGAENLAKAKALIDRMAADLHNLATEVEAAGTDQAKLKGIGDKFKAQAEGMKAEGEVLRKQLTDAENAEFQSYAKDKITPLTDRIMAAMTKAEMAEHAAAQPPTPELAPATPEAATPDPDVPAAASGPSMGEPIALSDSIWTILAAKDRGNRLKSNNMFQKPAVTDGRFIQVQFKVKNLKNKEERLLNHPKIVDSQGREFGPVDSMYAYIPKNTKSLQMEALPSSMDRTFFAVFEVPADAVGLQFKARELGFGDEAVLVPLGL